jgi:hypothetical protein
MRQLLKDRIQPFVGNYGGRKQASSNKSQGTVLSGKIKNKNKDCLFEREKRYIRLLLTISKSELQ